MIPRLDISFPIKRQWQYWFGTQYKAKPNEFLLNHARSGIVLALQAALPNGGRVGVVAYNCHTVANAIVSAGCTPVFIDVDEDLRIDVNGLKNVELDAIVVTNLFGIRNDIEKIRKLCPNVVIVDNAHGYGLPAEGDFTVYSINQGKYPALGPGGILIVNNDKYSIDRQLDNVNFIQQVKEYVSMLMKAILYHPWIYGWFTMRLKATRANNANHKPVKIKVMSPGVSRLYNAWLDEHKGQEVTKPFMDIIYTDDQDKMIAEYRTKNVEVATHFKNTIRWAKEFGYKEGMCPNAERLVHKLIMLPNYME